MRNARAMRRANAYNSVRLTDSPALKACGRERVGRLSLRRQHAHGDRAEKCAFAHLLHWAA